VICITAFGDAVPARWFEKISGVDLSETAAHSVQTRWLAELFLVLLIRDVFESVDNFSVELFMEGDVVMAVFSVAPCQCFSPGEQVSL
jgi:hypothetical protein